MAERMMARPMLAALGKEIERLADKIRPDNFAGIIGQTEAIALLSRSVEAAKARGDLVPGHILLIGGPGLGKTTIMRALANEIGGRFVALFGVNLRTFTDAIRPLLNAKPRDVLGIDEIHRMYRPVQEILYTVMEDGRAHIDGGGYIAVPPICIVGATTDPERLTDPMLDRFSLVVRLRPYTNAELMEIARRAASAMGVVLDDEAGGIIARAAAGTPRNVIRLVRAARDVAEQSATTRPAVIYAPAVRTVLSDPALVWDLEGRDAG